MSLRVLDDVCYELFRKLGVVDISVSVGDKNHFDHIQEPGYFVNFPSVIPEFMIGKEKIDNKYSIILEEDAANVYTKEELVGYIADAVFSVKYDHKSSYPKIVDSGIKLALAEFPEMSATHIQPRLERLFKNSLTGQDVVDAGLDDEYYHYSMKSLFKTIEYAKKTIDYDKPLLDKTTKIMNELLLCIDTLPSIPFHATGKTEYATSIDKYSKKYFETLHFESEVLDTYDGLRKTATLKKPVRVDYVKRSSLGVMKMITDTIFG